MAEDAFLEVAALDHIVLRVRDLEKSLAFYRDLLGLRIDFLDEYHAGTRPFVSARVGGQLLDLLPDVQYDPAAALPTQGFLHVCVRITRPTLPEAIPWLLAHGVDVVEQEPVARMGATGMGPSVYVRDPDGYVVELKEE